GRQAAPPPDPSEIPEPGVHAAEIHSDPRPEEEQVQHRSGITGKLPLQTAGQVLGRSPDQLGPEHTREYQLHLIHRQVSWSRFNQAVCALRFFYRVTLNRPAVVPLVPYGRKPRTLPAVLSPDEVARLFDVVAHPCDRLILTAAYAAGLRVSE